MRLTYGTLFGFRHPKKNFMCAGSPRGKLLEKVE